MEENAPITDPVWIQTPMRLQMRRIQYGVLPIVAVLLCAGVAAYMWHGSSGLHVSGEVDADRVSLASKNDGLLVAPSEEVKVHLFQRVSKDDVLARLDDGPMRAQIKRLETENKFLQSELDEKTKTHGAAVTSIEVVPDGFALFKNPSPNPDAPNTAPPDELPDPGMSDRSPAALRYAIASRQARIEELNTKIAARDIHAPFDGIIVQIDKTPGQAVQAGQPIFTIAKEKGDYIACYLRQNSRIVPRPGLIVQIRLPNRGDVYTSTIESVGPQMEKIPLHQLRDQKIQEWGIPVHVKMPAGLDLSPGELVDLRILPAEEPS